MVIVLLLNNTVSDLAEMVAFLGADYAGYAEIANCVEEDDRSTHRLFLIPHDLAVRRNRCTRRKSYRGEKDTIRA
jgi:hypothetical protein